MTALAERKTCTPEDLLAMPDGDRYELVDGELVEKEMGSEASWIGLQICRRLAEFAEDAGLGRVLPADASYQCFAEDPERVRRPDASFIPRDRLPGNRIPRGHILAVPALAVEVISPRSFFSEVRVKVDEYLRAGVQQVWIVDPNTRTIEVIRPDGSATLLRAADQLTGEDLLPGFRCPVSDLFPVEAAD
jgi:Uma2 family endonuclease